MSFETKSADSVQIRLTTGFDSHITAVDEGFAALTGWPAGEALNQTIAILFGPWSERGTVDRLTRAVERGETVEPTPVKLYAYSGQTFEAVASVAGGGPGVSVLTLHGPAGLGAPVPAAAQGPAEVAELVPPSADRLLPALVEAMRDAFAVTDEEGRLLLGNEPLGRMLGTALADLAGRPLAEVMDLRFPPGESEGLGAAVIHAAGAAHRSAAVNTARGIDQRGRPFRVLTFRATASGAGPAKPANPLQTRLEVLEQTLVRRISQEGRALAVGLLEIVADDEIARELGSVWGDTLERARLAAGVAVAGELRAGELYAVLRDDVLIVLLQGSVTVEEAQGRMQAIAQVCRHRLIAERGALAALEVLGGATMIGLDHPALRGGAGEGAVAERIGAAIRNDQGSGYQVETVIADILDEGLVVTHPVRGRDLGPARQTIAAFDERSGRWLSWLRKRHRLSPNLEREFDVALLGRVVERLHSGEETTGALLVPLNCQSLQHQSTFDRLGALVNGLPLAAKVRFQALVTGVPPDLQGERLLVFVRRVAAFGRGIWLGLDGLDSQGIIGRQEGLAGIALDHARLAIMIEREPMQVKHFIERLRAGNQPVLVHGVERPEQAQLLFNTFGVTLATGPGVERLANAPRFVPIET
ncbi:PAS domain-containing protein [Zavarzinia compransoris]|uniref:PAS domain-containing protein n=1 Tax=Zavarzinia compransoris TaxID=1264899 RepID=A0A317E7U5_9PROT|nr:PAS domain-containing protein [Zavarzinia compransoris]PWR22354.1 hypothetical protein DKG75_10415 [Zavarzinia compransoris]TDP46878.1 PAS domain-containing protein [Zavarzinia compransoris]